MATRLPPLNALRTFEAAARHLSFTKAADELFVTQTAVSHQIRALEEHLGAPLFRRMNRALLLTDQGQVAAAGRARGVRSAAGGRAPGGGPASGGALTISTTPSVAAGWLTSRLVRFQALHPEIELQLSATARLSISPARASTSASATAPATGRAWVSPAPVSDRAAAGVQPGPAGRRASAAASGGSGAAHPAARPGWRRRRLAAVAARGRGAGDRSDAGPEVRFDPAGPAGGDQRGGRRHRAAPAGGGRGRCGAPGRAVRLRAAGRLRLLLRRAGSDGRSAEWRRFAAGSCPRSPAPPRRRPRRETRQLPDLGRAGRLTAVSDLRSPIGVTRCHGSSRTTGAR